MDIDVRLELVHMQLTRKCNLNCWFCGQKDFKYYKLEETDTFMSLEYWKKVINSLADYREKSGISPSIMLWGGEPLLYKDFEKIVLYTHGLGFSLGMVTNGTMLSKYKELCREAFDKIYISVDGPAEIHDAIRGPGVFEQIKENMHELKGGPKLVNMAVLTSEVRNRLEWLLDSFVPLQPDEVILQEMIGLNKDEITIYKNWLSSEFGQKAFEIAAWERNIDYEPTRQKRDCLSQIQNLKYPFKVTYLPHGTEAKNKYCLSPFRHISIQWNGNVSFCTDFTDYSAGNVKEVDLQDIFRSDVADKFRREVVQGNCITCKHCSWKNNSDFNF